jgi:hypothetical protein
MYTLHQNTILEQFEIRKGFAVDYSGIEPKNYNNNGVWGHIVSAGEIVEYFPYNPNRWYGQGCMADADSQSRSALENLNRKSNFPNS